MSCYSHDRALLTLNRHAVLSALDDLQTRQVLVLENVYSAYTLLTFLVQNGFPQSGIRVIDGLPSSRYSALRISHVPLDDLKISGNDRSYAIVLYTVSTAPVEADRIAIQSILSGGKFQKLCIVGTRCNVPIKTDLPVTRLNFKPSVSNRNLFTAETPSEIGPVLKGAAGPSFSGNLAVLSRFDHPPQLAGFTSHTVTSVKELESLHLYNETNLIAVRPDWKVVKRLLDLVYFGELRLTAVIIDETALNSWVEDPFFHYLYHPDTVSDRQLLVSQWRPLLDQFNFVSTDIKVYHTIPESHYTVNQLVRPSFGQTLLELKLGLDCKESDPEVQQVNLYCLELLGYLNEDYISLNTSHILWKLTSMFGLSFLLFTRWIQLIACLGYAVENESSETVDQVMLFVSFLFHYEASHLKVTYLLHDLDNKFKVYESDILSILNYLDSGIDPSLCKAVGEIKTKLSQLIGSHQSHTVTDKLTESVLRCFRHAFFTNIGQIKQVDVRPGAPHSRLRVLDLQSQTIPGVIFQTSPELAQFYHPGDLVCWIELDRPLDSTKLCLFLGLKVSRNQVLEEQPYWRIT